METGKTPRFWARIKIAWRILTDPQFALRVGEPVTTARALKGSKSPGNMPSDERLAFFLLSSLQREGRLIDFLQQNVSDYSDAEVGAAARVVHAGCKKFLREHLTLKQVVEGEEGRVLSVEPGFDAGRIRLTGNLSGEPPFRGTLKHHGWLAVEASWPGLQENIDPRILSPAEVELP